MADVNTPKLLLSLAKLIERPEIRALEVSLIKTVGELVPADSISLFEIKHLKQVTSEVAETYLVPVGYEDTPEELLIMPKLMSEEPQFEECHRSQRLVVTRYEDKADSMLRFVHPMLGVKKDVTGFLVIEKTSHIAQEQELVSILLAFYRNYILLLNDNQRDHLTGLLNRKSFDDKIMKIILSLSEHNKRKADKAQYYLAVFDIDHFKRVNDTLGHLMGDEVLLHFSQCMNNTFREYDMLFRVGGEEFVVVLRNVDYTRTAAIMERFRTTIETHYFPQVGQITTSIGVTSICVNDLPVTIMDRADQALYYIKDHGRNQTAFYETLIAEGKLKAKELEGDIDMF